jgi:TonB family protein
MKVTVRADPPWLRKAFSLAVSVSLHGSALAWVLFAPVVEDPTPVLNREIRPNATRIVWYSLKQQLPAISPTERSQEQRAPRALTRSPISLVAGKQDLLRPPQLIWTPAPPLDSPKLLPSPNIVTLARPARPQPQRFVPPPEAPAKAPVVFLPAAPELTVALEKRTASPNLLPPLAAARKTFIPPVEAARQPKLTPVNLPAAPAIAVSAPDRPLLTTMAKPLRNFTPPEDKRLPATPAPAIAEAPDISENRSVEASLAIVGLLPTRSPEIPVPKTSQEAGFSAGPQPQAGADETAQQSQLVVPGLLARNVDAGRQAVLASLEAPTSLRNLSTAARNISIGERSNNPPAASLATRVSEAPDPRLRGRMVYSMALQMPNVTSYSGSWIVWFAERGAEARPRSPQPPPNMTPPVPVRKVDPKYDPAAVTDRIEGRVRLAAVIRQDGRVDTVEVLQGLDSRLDRSAAEALAKWEFEPAERNGAAIDVDAVFEIPFHLAPRLAR